ncbi:hypothetical protein GALMADRAFT_452235 [Galerina marginata CBS 339.88]|uniref:Cyclin-like domain-containing protein n=1 Tax=Galerina marginata (strain CBS 339.88) TaxID=685588 RepID=A0A067T0F5_GALM3|nr:hypothetical protein GALMADRAFT_452235 [Galerina marginata CBS 339.88]
MSTTPCPGAPRQPPAGLSTAAPTTPEKDSYYGHEHTARLAARFITHLFACPEEPPASSPSHSQAKLPFFIAYALYRTKLHSAVTFTALLLLQRLKTRFPSARGSSGHRLFISAFMIASKVVCDDTYSNKSWCIVAQNMFTLREINQMEREMCSYLDWELWVDGKNLSNFTKAVTEDFGEDKDWRTYPAYPSSFVSKRAKPKETSFENNNARQASPHEDADGELGFPWHEEHSDVESEDSLPKSMDVRMFSNARNFSIRDTAINNAGGDITIHHHHHTHFHQESQIA